MSRFYEPKLLRYSRDSVISSQKNEEYDVEKSRKSGTTWLDTYSESSQTYLSISDQGIDNDNASDSTGDNACGEAFVAQRILIDFTPTDADTEDIQKKVNDFWDFVDANPELKACIVKPGDLEPEVEPQKSCSSHHFPTSPSQATPVTKSPISMMSMINKRGIAQAALTKLVDSNIPDPDSSNFAKNQIDSSKNQSIDSRRKKSNPHNLKHAKGRPPQTSSRKEVREMCQVLRQWDDLHPKTLDPPGQTPLLPPIL